MTMMNNERQAIERLGLSDLRATAHWCLTEGSGDDATHQAMTWAISEI